jgi:hypothetical protein
VTSSAGLSTGNGRRTKPFTALRTAVFTPMPMANASTAIAVKPGRFAKILIA